MRMIMMSNANSTRAAKRARAHNHGRPQVNMVYMAGAWFNQNNNCKSVRQVAQARKTTRKAQLRMSALWDMCAR